MMRVKTLMVCPKNSQLRISMFHIQLTHLHGAKELGSLDLDSARVSRPAIKHTLHPQRKSFSGMSSKSMLFGDTYETPPRRLIGEAPLFIRGQSEGAPVFDRSRNAASPVASDWFRKTFFKKVAIILLLFPA